MIKTSLRALPGQSLLALFGIALASACVSPNTHKALIEVDYKLPADKPSQASQQRDRLLAFIDDDKAQLMLAQDILSALEAEDFEERGLWVEAAGRWLEVLKADKNALAEKAFERWVKAEMRRPSSSYDSDSMARLLLAQTHDARDSQWLLKQNLQTRPALIRKLEPLMGLAKQAAEPRPDLPRSPADLSNDPYWEKAAKLLCGRETPAAWKPWIAARSPGEKIYWNALIESCNGHTPHMFSELRAAVPLLYSEERDLALTVRAAELFVQVGKSIGDREGTTKAYQIQSQVLKRGDLPLEKLGWSVYEKSKRQIESQFWVGRNLALQGDYGNAKIAVHEGLAVIRILYSDRLDAKQKKDLDELKADGYHILASRIAYEQGDLLAALSLTKVAQDIPGLSSDWTQRLLWAKAWYHYSLGDRTAAIAVWEKFLAGERSESSQTKALYWIGRSHWENNSRATAESYFERLVKQSPLSFYAVIGLAQIKHGDAWHEDFHSPEELVKRLKKTDGFVSEAYTKDAEAMRRLQRAELVIAADVGSWKSLMAWELYRYVSVRKSLMADREGALYVSRVLHMSGQHLLSISLTTTLLEKHDQLWDKNPEQLLVFFPYAFAESYNRFAAQNGIEKEIALAISRQESSFRPEAESGVGAIGLMQLMPNTAKQMAGRVNLQLSGIESSLRQPDININLGTVYLVGLGRRYGGEWPRAFSAYNAGEYATDAWTQRRKAGDLIAWSEALSFGETSGYVKNVWRNWEVYKWLSLNQR